jgi:hypothetical protein
MLVMICSECLVKDVWMRDRLLLSLASDE